MISGWAAAHAGNAWAHGGIADQLLRGGWLTQPYAPIYWLT